MEFKCIFYVKLSQCKVFMEFNLATVYVTGFIFVLEFNKIWLSFAGTSIF